MVARFLGMVCMDWWHDHGMTTMFHMIYAMIILFHIYNFFWKKNKIFDKFFVN